MGARTENPVSAAPLTDEDAARLTDEDIAGYVVAAVWAPSVHNAQPWRFAVGVAALLTTAGDRPADWVNAGQALQRILLTASSYGAAAALHTQPLELGWLRESIRTRISDGAYPQLVLRFGAVVQTAASVRRPPCDVLTASGENASISHV
jgi:hypothetical protein